MVLPWLAIIIWNFVQDFASTSRIFLEERFSV